MRYYDYLGRFISLTKDPTLAGVKFLLEGVGNPHNDFKSVHVAGTNGKGSVVEAISSILRSGSYKVGKFISPYLTRFNEYISINQELISDQEVEEHLSRLKPLINEYQGQGHQIKYFEIVTAIAFMHFAKHKVDIAVVEVGMGGENDCTNVITPLVSVITQVHLDHKEVLGQTIEKIAHNKAGIIKQNVPCITSNLGEALTAIKKKARSMNSELVTINPHDVSVSNLDINKLMSIKYMGNEYQTALRGRHQGVNTMLAVKAIEQLKKQGMKIPKSATVQGLANIYHPARLEIVSKEPLIIFDGAHNANSIEGFLDIVSDYFPKQKKLFIVSMLSRKDPDEAMESLAKLGRETSVIFTSGISGEFHDARMLRKSFEKFCNKKTQTMEFEKAYAEAGKFEATFVVGSFKTYTKVR